MSEEVWGEPTLTCGECGVEFTHNTVHQAGCSNASIHLDGAQRILRSQNVQARPRSERDPTGADPKRAGAKLDAGKSPVRRGLLEYFPRACMAVANVSAAGARKYTWKGWESVPEGVDRYGDAGVRHICKAAIAGSPTALDSDWREVDPALEVWHAAEEAWNALARLELLMRKAESDAKGT